MRQAQRRFRGRMTNRTRRQHKRPVLVRFSELCLPVLYHLAVIRSVLHDAIHGSRQENRGGVWRAAQGESSGRRVLIEGRRQGTRTRSRYYRQCGPRPLSVTSHRMILEHATYDNVCFCFVFSGLGLLSKLFQSVLYQLPCQSAGAQEAHDTQLAAGWLCSPGRL